MKDILLHTLLYMYNSIYTQYNKEYNLFICPSADYYFFFTFLILSNTILFTGIHFQFK